MEDYLVRGSLADLDPAVAQLAAVEAERQYRKLILIPSESYAPQAVLDALATKFSNLYAEGYPPEHTRLWTEEEILDAKTFLAEYRRLSDPRYYKGVEYADMIEALARRRCAELFATSNIDPEDIFVNVQPLSGSPANAAVFHALLNIGDTILSLDLIHGGHLTHGSKASRSGKWYNVVHYTVNAKTEQIDYYQIEALAKEHRPRLIIAGYSSYPWAVNWQWLGRIAREVGAYLLADIAHVAGLVVAGVYPNPIEWAHVVTFTTHKTLMGPRGAVILTTDPAIARKIDRAVFPGEQGGPHLNTIAAMAVAFKIAKTPQFKELQAQIVKNCKVLTERLRERGFRIPYGGTDTHLMNLDCKSVVGKDGTRLNGDLAARILDVAGIVVNRNTIPGDKNARNPSGIRMGTPWITQRGFREEETRELADIIADVLQAIEPYTVDGRTRAKVDYQVLKQAQVRVRELAAKAGIDFEPRGIGYPHFFYPDDRPRSTREHTVLVVGGPRVRAFLQHVLTADVEALQPGESAPARAWHPEAGWLDVVVTCVEPARFHVTVATEQAVALQHFWQSLSDGYIHFDDPDIRRKIPGPVWVKEDPEAEPVTQAEGEPIAAHKPYFLGIHQVETPQGEPLPEFTWEEKEPETLQRTALYEVHKRLGAKFGPFAGWEMPLRYTSAKEEHQAVREAAGIFDLGHMGIFEISGPDAAAFLDSVIANDIGKLRAHTRPLPSGGHQLILGESAYGHILDPEGRVIDDVIAYRVGPETFFLVVNAANTEKVWAWLHAVKEGRVRVDRQRPWVRAFGRYQVTIRDLKAREADLDRRMLIAVQGPKALDVLLALGTDPSGRVRLKRLGRGDITEVFLGGFDIQLFDVYVARTGYTGHKTGYEVFVHPMHAPMFFNAILDVAKELGVKPCGLEARDSLRTEAGLPLYGHELAGPLGLGVGDAGLTHFVKTYKPWFIGRDAFLEQEARRKREVVRFKVKEKPVPVAHLGDPVLDRRGRVIGRVTSCVLGGDGYLVGLAWVDKSATKVGTPLYILPGASRRKAAIKPPAEWQDGDQAVVPVPAEVVKRFERFP